MNRYPHHRWSPVFGFAAVAATAVTLAVAVVAPARMDANRDVESVLAKREARPAQVDVRVERIDVVASRPAVVVAKPIVPTALADTEPRG